MQEHAHKVYSWNWKLKISEQKHEEKSIETTTIRSEHDKGTGLSNLKFQKIIFFTFSHFSLYWKIYFSPWATDSVKSSSTDSNQLYKVWQLNNQTFFSKKLNLIILHKLNLNTLTVVPPPQYYTFIPSPLPCL